MKYVVLDLIKKKSINFELLLELTEIEKTELENILKELIKEKQIFVNSLPNLNLREMIYLSVL